MNKRSWSVVAIVAAILGVIAIALPLIFGYIGSATSDRPAGTVAFDPNTDYIPVEALCVDNHYKDNSIRIVKAGDDAFRQFATAVSTPFVATTGEAALTEYLDEGCGNATLLSQDVDEMLLWTDQEVPGADQNKAWLNEIKTYITENGLDAFNAKTADGVKIVTPKFQTFRSWVNTIWLRFTPVQEAQPLVSDRNWEVSAVASPKTQPVPYISAGPDNKDAFELRLNDKNGCLASEALNILDKRVEHISSDDCKPTPPKASDCVGSSCGGTTPECTDENPCIPVKTCLTEYPEFPHGTYPNCKDGQDKSPFNNGDGSTGGGPAATDGPGDKTVLQPTTDTPYVAPPAPAPAPVATPDPAPAPAPEPSAAPVDAPATGCSPPPGMTTCP